MIMTWGWGLPLSSSGWRPEVLLNTLQCTAPTAKNYLGNDVSSADVKKPLPYTHAEIDSSRKVNLR